MRAEAAAVRRESYEGKGAAGRFYLGDTPLVLEELLRQYAGQVKACLLYTSQRPRGVRYQSQCLP